MELSLKLAVWDDSLTRVTKSLSLYHTADQMKISWEMIKGLSTEWSLIISAGQELGITDTKVDCHRQDQNILIHSDLQTACTCTHTSYGNGSYKGGRLRHTWFMWLAHCISPSAMGCLKKVEFFLGLPGLLPLHHYGYTVALYHQFWSVDSTNLNSKCLKTIICTNLYIFNHPLVTLLTLYCVGYCQAELKYTWRYGLCKYTILHQRLDHL